LKSSDDGTPLLHVGILRTDRVLEGLQATHGDYPDMFAALLSDPALSEDLPDPPKLMLSAYDVQQGEFPAATACEAYVVTGSRHSVYDDLPWIAALVAFLREALAARRTVVGICFGHQLIAHYFGGETRAADSGWCVGVHRAQVLEQEAWMQPPRPCFNLLSSHRDQAMRLPAAARRFAASAACPNAGFVMEVEGGGRVLTFQGHPEFSKPYARELMATRRDALGAERLAAGMDSLQEPLDNAVVARWILNFLSS
jgi:GMP synthase-like glutamine amidotransferase